VTTYLTTERMLLRPPPSTGLDHAAIATAELGYRLLPAAWGRGCATEGARALVRRACTELGLDRVVATTMTVNVASSACCRKLGCHWSAPSTRSGPPTSRAPSAATL